MNNFAIYTALCGGILLLGAALNRFSKFMKMPILICFLGVGILFGKHGLQWFPPALNIKGVQIFGEIALCFIIFSGGLETSFNSIKRVFFTGTILATVGVILTAGVTALFVYWISYLSLFVTLKPLGALLVGAIFASTDAAAVFAILRGQKAAIPAKLQSLLEFESGSNDPAAFLLTSVLISIAVSGKATSFSGISWDIFSGIVWGLGAGALVGFLIGLFGQWFYNWIQKFLEYNGLRLVVAIAIVLIGYGITAGVFKANSLMACYVAGITMGNMRFSYKSTFIKFQQGISWLMQILLFTLLGAFFDFRMLFDHRIVIGAILISLTLMFIARPLVVMLCMIRSPFNFRERLFTSWVGIRGSAPIMLSALVLASAPPEYAIRVQNLFYMVFTVVLLSILIQGSSLMWVAAKLGLIMPYEEKDESPLEYDERADGREMYQFTVSEKSPLVNCELGVAGLGTSAVLLMIKRGEKYIQPTSDVVIKQGDGLTFLGERKAMLTLHDDFFADELYAPPKTFHQLWIELAQKYGKKRHQETRNKAKQEKK